jgi:hypothetical protein
VILPDSTSAMVSIAYLQWLCYSLNGVSSNLSV